VDTCSRDNNFVADTGYIIIIIIKNEKIRVTLCENAAGELYIDGDKG